MKNFKNVERKQWIKFGVATVLYLLFLLWVKSAWGLLVLPFIFDAYITGIIPWTWWKKSKSKATRSLMSWVDAIVFALVAVYFVNIYFVQNFVIPSSSLEKSLLVGDYLLVSKVNYGPRIPNTPLTLPLTQHTLPVVGGKSYLEWPQWAYRRVPGLGSVQLNDIVVFNFPAGDTILANPAYQVPDFYTNCYVVGESLYPNRPVMDSLTAEQQYAVYQLYYNAGRNFFVKREAEFGKIDWRPVDRRENYVKRCVGLPGQTIEIKDRIVYLDGVPNAEPENVQYNYRLKLRRPLDKKLVKELGISREDLPLHASGTITLPLTRHAYEALRQRTDVVESIEMWHNEETAGLYPLNMHTGWTTENYGPLWIPQKGKSVGLTIENLPLYERPIAVYEGNQLEVKEGKIYINGQESDSYTFKMDYYWMMGDNRHNSADSRYWGFVPEDHVVGKPLFVWLSLDKDYGLFDGKIRWNRIFKWVGNIK